MSIQASQSLIFLFLISSQLSPLYNPQSQNQIPIRNRTPNKFTNLIHIKYSEDYQLRKINFTRHVGFLMTEEMFKQILKITDKREIPISQYIREVLEDRLNQAEGGSMR